MLRVIIILCGFFPASLEMQNGQDQVDMSRKTTADTVTTSLFYNKVGEGPARGTTFDVIDMKPTEKYADITTKVDVGTNNVTVEKTTTDYQDSMMPSIKDKGVYLSSKEDDERVKAISKLQLLGKEALEDIEQQNTYTLLATHSNLNPNTLKEMFTMYTADKEFRIDNEDVRSDSRNTYNGWPYSYNGPYDYQIKKFNKNEKAKDKRFLSADTTINPVHEIVAENVPVGYISNVASPTDHVIDNPIYGDQPFFSFVLNDYFDRHQEEDPLIFKDFSWSEEFDNGLSSNDMEDNERRIRRLHNSKNPNEIQNMDMSQKYKQIADKKLVTEKPYPYDSGTEYEKYRKNDGKKDHQGSNNNNDEQRKTAFKDFADLFANKFGSEEHNKNSKFMLKTSHDKGENRRGFKRVYHKDEYQEDNEFYDNTNKSVQSEENGGSNFNIGGSQSLLQSQAFGSASNEANSAKTRDNKNHKTLQNRYGTNEGRKDGNDEINHYRDIAKDAALSNNADYIDNFRK